MNKKKFAGWYPVICGIQICILIICAVVLMPAKGKNTVYDDTKILSGEAPLMLERGSYRITLSYETTLDAVRVTPLLQTSHGMEDAESVFLLKDKGTQEFELFLTALSTEVYLVIPYTEEIPDVMITSMQVSATGQFAVVISFLLLLVFLLFDILYAAIKLQWWQKLDRAQQTAAVCIPVICILASIPLLVNYLTSGHDLTFHLMRIEGLAQGLREGQFPVKMQPLWLNDYGYPVSIMYGDLLLYVPALLRLLGFTLQTSYKLYVVLVQILTAGISYVCAKKIAGNDTKLGIFGCFMYMLAANRMINIFYRSAVGEYTAFTFYPLVYLGLWYLLGKPKEETGDRKKAFYLLVAGYTMILESHLLSFEMIVVFSVGYCLLHFGRFKKHFLFLVKTALVTITLNLVFLVPMLDYMLAHDMKVEIASAYNMQEHGLFLSQLFQMFCFNGSGSAAVMDGVGNDTALGIGMPFMLMIALFLWEVLVIRYGREKGNVCLLEKEAYLVFVLMLAAIAMSTYYFPWNAISNIPYIGKLLTPYQFAWRFIGIATMLGVMLGVYALGTLGKLKDRSVLIAVVTVLCTLTLVGAEYLIDNKVSSNDTIKITSYAALDTRGAVANGEYLPIQVVSLAEIKDSAAIAEDETAVVIENYRKENGIITMECKNLTDAVQKVWLPHLNYKGYAAADTAAKEPLELSADESGQLQVLLPAEYEGEIAISFVQPWYWRAAELVSLLAAGCVIAAWKKEFRKRDLC